MNIINLSSTSNITKNIYKEIKVLQNYEFKNLNFNKYKDKSILIFYTDDFIFPSNFLDESKYSKIINIIKYDNTINLTSIIKRYLILYELKKQLINEKLNIENLILFGSLPTLNITNKSDIDLFLVTKDFNKIYSFLKTLNLNKFGKLKNKIYFYIENILIEINCLNNLQEVINSSLCYNGYIVNTPSNLLDNEKRFVILHGENCSEVLNSKNNYSVDIKYYFEEFWYYYHSLNNLKDDIYKFNFHWFILTHSYIRIKSYLKDKDNYNYLPKNSYELLTTLEKERLFTKNKDLNNKILNLDIIIQNINSYWESIQ